MHFCEQGLSFEDTEIGVTVTVEPNRAFSC